MTKNAGMTQGMLLFRLNSSQTFAIGTLKIKELVPYVKLTILPQSHPSVLGSANIRGNTITVIDMAAAVGYRSLSEEEMPRCHIIVTDCQRMMVGFMVRGIDKIINCSWRDISSPPKNLGASAFLSGVTKVDDELIQILDVELLMSKMFPQPEQDAIDLNREHREQLQCLNILLVDDSLVARKQLSDALKKLDIPYKVTVNGKDALDIMVSDAEAGNAINILVSDIEMPGLDGYELAFEVKNNANIASAYIILHTSLSSEISVGQAHQVGANEALTKFDADELIQAMLRGSEQQNNR
jgi:two-component system chemotaxis response regulator CheV